MVSRPLDHFLQDPDQALDKITPKNLKTQTAKIAQRSRKDRGGQRRFVSGGGAAAGSVSL